MCLLIVFFSPAVLGGVNIPVLVGSGVTKDNYHLYRQAHGLIVGSYFKRNGNWQEDIDSSRVKAFMENVSSVRHIPVESTMIVWQMELKHKKQKQWRQQQEEEEAAAVAA